MISSRMETLKSILLARKVIVTVCGIRKVLL